MDDRRRKPGIGDIWKLILAIIGVIAVVQELRKPKEERTWHGRVAEIFPYDFRMPTWERIKGTYWNPEGAPISGKVFGVGWAPNFGVIARWLGKSDVTEPTGAADTD